MDNKNHKAGSVVSILDAIKYVFGFGWLDVEFVDSEAADYEGWSW